MKNRIEQEVEKTMQALSNQSPVPVPIHLYQTTLDEAQRRGSPTLNLVWKWAAIAVLVLGNVLSIYHYQSINSSTETESETTTFIQEYALSEVDYSEYLNQAP